MAPADSRANGSPAQVETLKLATVLQIRQEFHNLASLAEVADSFPPKASACFAPQDLAQMLKARYLIGEDRGLNASDSGADAEQRAELFTRDVRKLGDGTVDVDEWAHHMLWHFCGKKTTRAMAQLGALLDLAVKQRPGVVNDLCTAFDAAPEPQCGRAGFTEVVELYARQLRSLCNLPGEEALASDDRAFARDVAKLLELSDDVAVSYSDFMACFLGRTHQEVYLNIYDLSNGKAQTLSRWLPIPELDGLWHSGLVVFGSEYFYCGDVICALPGRTVFGAPSKHLSLGRTLRQRAELHQFIVQEIKPAFTRDKYDTLYHNCNHFSDRLCGWLGCQGLPQEILHQHVKILEAPFAKAVWPILNHVLGGSSLTSCTEVDSLRCHSIVIRSPASIDPADARRGAGEASECLSDYGAASI